MNQVNLTQKLLIVCLLTLAVPAFAQTVSPLLQPHQTFLDSGGAACSGCKLYTYAAGTTTPQATYTDSTGTIQNQNPIILDVAGGANIWLSGNPYRLDLKDASGSIIWSVDNVSGLQSPYIPPVNGTAFGSVSKGWAVYASSLTVAGGFNPSVISGAVSFPGNPTFGGNPTFSGAATFTAPITIQTASADGVYLKPTTDVDGFVLTPSADSQTTVGFGITNAANSAWTFKAKKNGDVIATGALQAGSLAQTATYTAHTFFGNNTAGALAPAAVQPGFSDLSGGIAVAQMNSGTNASASTFWRGDGIWATPMPLLTNYTAVTASANVTTAQNLMAITIPANEWSVVGKTIVITAAGICNTQSAQTPTITFALNVGALALDSWTTAATTASSQYQWNYQLTINTATAGSSGSLGFSREGAYMISSGTAASTSLMALSGSSAVNLTISNSLQLQVTFSTNAATANNCTQRQFIVQELN